MYETWKVDCHQFKTTLERLLFIKSGGKDPPGPPLLEAMLKKSTKYNLQDFDKLIKFDIRSCWQNSENFELEFRANPYKYWMSILSFHSSDFTQNSDV